MSSTSISTTGTTTLRDQARGDDSGDAKDRNIAAALSGDDTGASALGRVLNDDPTAAKKKKHNNKGSAGSSAPTAAVKSRL